MSRLLLPLEPIYRLGMERRRAANLARRAASPSLCPTLSVGNLTVGGTGKTPTVQWVTRLLQERGLTVGIASRGYGGKLSDVGALVSDGQQPLLSAAQAGDEALLHARNLPGVIVAIAKDRHHAVELAVQTGAQVVVLDDGFQFWSLPRAFDFLLLDARRPFDNGHLLPAGRLRELPDALCRADALLLTRADLASPDQLEAARREIARWTKAPVFEATHAPIELRHEQSGEIWPLNWLQGRRVNAMSAIADNESFFDLLATLGAEVYDRNGLKDHSAWSEKACRDASTAAQGMKAEVIVTTEKDAVKMDAALFEVPLLSLRIGLHLHEEAALKSLIYGKLWPSAAIK